MIVTLFLIISALGLLLAAGTVMARNLVHAALYLVGFFFTIACQFVLLEAEFLAAIQVIVYIGAVAIILLFGIMLTRNIQGDETTTVRWAARFPAALAALAVLTVLVYGIGEQVSLRGEPSWSERRDRPPASLPADPGAKPDPRAAAINDMGRAVGVEMMTRFLIPFEAAGLLLTAALIGAVALAQLEGADEPPHRRMFPALRPRTVGNGSGTAGPAPSPAQAPTEALLTPASEPR